MFYDITDNRELEDINIAEHLDGDTLSLIGRTVVSDFEDDLDSRSDWEDSNDEWLKLATQTYEEKSFPWPNASSVKYPLLSTASLQFHARAYPSLVNEAKLVKIKTLGSDPENHKHLRALRVQTYMSYQILHAMDNWQEDMDRMLYILPLIGTTFKKLYYDPMQETNVSILVDSRDLVINYYAEDFDKARKTHRILMDRNEIFEHKQAGIYLNVDLSAPTEGEGHDGVEDEIVGLTPSAPEEDIPHTILECHRLWDLDGDGYKEPYVITVDKDTKKVLRITARWSVEGVITDGAGNLIKIIPNNHFVQYGFIPNPESKIYYQGFGSLLGPTNAAVNTLIDQLINAGTLSNTSGGFLGKGVRVRGGALRFKPNEWKQVQSTGDDLRKGIYPLPVREPSNVLFQLLGTLIAAGEKMASVKDVMTGENPGQNQPYSTTIAVLEQGMKVFVSIYKRIYRALGKEYQQLFALNRVFLDDAIYNNVLETQDLKVIDEFNIDKLDIIPGADPSILSEAHRMARAESLLQKLAAGLPLNPEIVLRRMLEAEGHEDIDLLMQVQPPQPDFNTQLEIEKFKHQQTVDAAELEIKAANTQHEALKDWAQAQSLLAKAKATEASTDLEEEKAIYNIYKDQEEAITKRLQAVGSLLSKQQGAEGGKPSSDTSPTEGAPQ